MTHRSRLLRRTLTVLGLAALGPAGLAALPANAAQPLSSVSGVTVAMSLPSASAGALTRYSVTFQTSASGSLPGNSTITVSLPAGTGLSHLETRPGQNWSYASTVVWSGVTSAGTCLAVTATAVTCTIVPWVTVPGGAWVTVILLGVNNPAIPGAYALSVSTSADTTAATSASYTVNPATQVARVHAVLSNTLPGATGVTYTVHFKTVTALNGSVHSAIAITFPLGTSLTGATGGHLITTNGTVVWICSATSRRVIMCADDQGTSQYEGGRVSAGAGLTVTVSGITSPPSARTYPLKVATTSDVVPATTHYRIAAPGAAH